MYLTVFIFMLVGCGILRSVEHIKDHESYRRSSRRETTEKEEKSITRKFLSFRTNYLFVYLLAVGADWLQGPYVYALYTHYGYNKAQVGKLYIAGFASSALFGTFVASLADKYGRRSNVFVYCISYILSCFTKHSSKFFMLFLGRILGGIAYSILFSAFESWMVYEHNRKGFSSRLLSDTFSKAQFGNGLVAIVSGLIAGALADRYGKVSPFDASIVTLVVLLGIVSYTWSENYGDSKQSVTGGFANAWKAVVSDEKILMLGIIQSAFEGAMYTFTFVWTPALQEAAGSLVEIPHGLIFATFMAATMIGSSLLFLMLRTTRIEFIMRNVFLIGVFTFGCAVLTLRIELVYASFLLFEVLCGIYFPGMATMRAPYIPEEQRSAILTFFRVPLNLIVVSALYEDLSLKGVFILCTALMIVAVVAQQRLIALPHYTPDATEDENIFSYKKDATPSRCERV